MKHYGLEPEQIERQRTKPLDQRDWREQGDLAGLTEKERNEVFIRQALRELHQFSETMRQVPGAYQKEIRQLLAGINIMLDNQLAAAQGQRFSPFPPNARSQFKAALEPLGFQPKPGPDAEK